MEVASAVALVLLAALAALWFAARNAITILVAEVRDGRLQVTRGGVAPRILADLADVVARPPAQRAVLKIVRSGGSAELEARGDLSAAQLQQLRNVVGSVPLAKLVNGRRPR